MISIRYLQLFRNTSIQVFLPWSLCKSCVRCECSFVSAAAKAETFPAALFLVKPRVHFHARMRISWPNHRILNSESHNG